MKGHQINTAIYGENHPIIALDFENLAAFFLSLNNYSEALSFFTKSYQIRQKILGEDHEDTARVQQGIQEMIERLSPVPSYQRNGGKSTTGPVLDLKPRRAYGESIVHRKYK